MSLKQWFSLIILTIGCIVKYIDLDLDVNIFSTKLNFNSNIILIFIQVSHKESYVIEWNWTLICEYFQTICSCLAGVYNEYLLKEPGANNNIFLQNIFMYIDSIFCNVIVFIVLFILESSPFDMSNNVDHSILLEPKVIIIMLNNTAIGIITSFFLKTLNSILKTFASALELVFIAILCWLIFNIPIQMNTVLSIAMVCYAVILYSQNPIQNVWIKDHILLIIKKNWKSIYIRFLICIYIPLIYIVFQN